MGNWDSVATSPDADARPIRLAGHRPDEHPSRHQRPARPRPRRRLGVCTHEDVTEAPSEERLRYLAPRTC